MKITWQEVRAAEDAVQQMLDAKDDFGLISAEDSLLKYLEKRPHLFFPLGYDECVSFKSPNLFVEKWLGAEEDHDLAEIVIGDQPSILRRPTGQWLNLHTLELDERYRHCKLQFHSRNSFVEHFKFFSRFDEVPAIVIPDLPYASETSLLEFFRALYKVAGRWLDEPRCIWSPKLWTPDIQEETRLHLRSSIGQIITSLRQNTMTLHDLSWSQFEELVAELLRGIGMDVYRVTERPQGGRDLLARGELIPGEEPVTIAVEVKHNAIVNRPEVEMALWQNKMFPALLFVTSGRFSSGVLTEKRKAENQLRLFLKDGVALEDLVRRYAGPR
jgi:Restriction endonuclease